MNISKVVKKAWLFTSLMIIAFVATINAQYQEQDIVLEASGYYLNTHNYTPRIVGGLNAHVFLAPNFSIDFRVAAGQRYVRSSLNTGFGAALSMVGIGSAIELASSSRKAKKSDWAVVSLGIITLLTAEGFTYYIPLNKKIKAAPYVHYLAIEHIRNKESTGQDTFFSGAVGFRLDWNPIPKLVIAPFIEGSRLYSKKAIWGYNFGLNIGIKTHSYSKRQKKKNQQRLNRKSQHKTN